MDSLRGKLLVASPTLLDPNFLRTVVLITEHGDDGAMGVVLSRPSTSTVDEAAPELVSLVGEGEDVFIGGPVQTDALVVLADFHAPDDAGVPVFDGVGFVGSESDPGAVEAAASRARVFAGFAGWSPGQLETELQRDDWILEPAVADDVFTSEPGELWSDVLARKGGEYALVARMPLDPSVN